MRISDYTVPELDKFRKLANFTNEELDYFELRAVDTTNEMIALTMCVSDSKVSKLARKVKDKIKRVEKALSESTVIDDG